VLVAAVTAVAKVVTPRVVPTVVLTAPMDQNVAIAMAATVLANSFRGAKRLFIILLTLLSSNVEGLNALRV
jgi:hypothetical protein